MQDWVLTMAVSLILLPAGFQWRICARAGSSSTMLISRLTFWRESEIIRLKNLEGETGTAWHHHWFGKRQRNKMIYFESPFVEENNALKTELQLFAQSIIHNTATAVNPWGWLQRFECGASGCGKIICFNEDDAELKQRSLKFNGTVLKI